jgi:hypothetical protein
MLRNEIRAGLGACTTEGPEVCATWSPAASFSGFQGHFPGQPVLPGVCLVQAGLALFEACRSVRAQLQRLESAKFTQPVVPGTLLRLTGRAEPAADGTELLRVRVWCGERRAAELALRVRWAGA